jgi:hypothetical protein
MNKSLLKQIYPNSKIPSALIPVILAMQSGDVAPFPITPELQAIAIMYKNPALIADLVLPYTPVGKQTFKYRKFTKAENFTIPDTKVGRKSEPNKVEFTFTETEATCGDYGLDDLIPQEDYDNAPEGYDPESHAVEGLTELVLLDREVRAAALVFAAGSYASANKIDLTGVAGTQWDEADGDPIEDIQTGLDACIMRPNKMVIGQLAWSVLRRHSDIVSAVLGNSGTKGIVSRQAVADLFELEEVIVGQGFLNSSKKGQTPVFSRVWGKHVALIHQNPNAGVNNGTTFGYTARFGNRIAGRIPAPTIGLKGSTLVRSGESVKELITANDLGYFIENVIN